MIKDFLKEYDHFRLSIQHLDLFDGCWEVRLYNTTLDPFEPIFKHRITDLEIDNLNVDFETIIMTPVINCIKDLEANRFNIK